jgi:LacI family transcriptional regulator
MTGAGGAPDGFPVTMREIASEAGVHPSTVSRALRRARSGLPPASQRESNILQITERLGYTPDPTASSLRGGQSRAIGVLVPRLTDTVLATIYDSIESAAHRAGYEAFVANSNDDPDLQARRLQLLLSRRVDGIILGDARRDQDLSAVARTTHLVLVSRGHPDLPSATCDDFRGGWLAGDHLARLGHTTFAVVAGPPWAQTSFDRTTGFRAALAEHGLRLRTEDVYEVGFDTESGRTAGDRMLARRTPPTAVFAMNDHSAIGVMGALRAKGLRPGTDVAVVGFNDIPIAAELPIPLTSVRSPLQRMAEEAADMLLRLMSGGSAASVKLEPTLNVRASSDPTVDPVVDG